MASTPPIRFFYSDTKFSFRNRNGMKSFVHRLFKKEGKKLKNLNYVFCTDIQLLKINKEYLAHDFFTDIITFDLSGDPQKIEAEIYISIDRVRENAGSFKTSFRQELNRVIFHGALHLCGYSDKTNKEKELMKSMEEYYLKRYKTVSP